MSEKLATLKPVLVYDWKPFGRKGRAFICGNVVVMKLRELSTWMGDCEFERWMIFKLINNRLVPHFNKSRPWFYGDSGSAKVGCRHLLRRQLNADNVTKMDGTVPGNSGNIPG